MNWNFGDDILDIRDIIETFEELEQTPVGESDLARLGIDPYDDDHKDGVTLSDLTLEQVEILARSPEAMLGDDSILFISISKLLDGVRGYGGDEQWRGDWYPVTLIRDRYFEDYARDLADDIGALSPGATWPHNHIDWAAAAQDLLQDYSQTDIGGQVYYYR